MRMRRMLAVSRKEFIHIIRDPRSLGMGIAIPMLMLILFGYALTLDVDKVPLAVWDQSRSSESREFLSRFNGSRYFSAEIHASSYKELEGAIDSGKVIIALVVPRDFSQSIAAGRQASVQAIVDGSDSNTASIAMSYADIVAQQYSSDAILDFSRRTTGRAPQIPVNFKPRVWFNAEMESRNYIVPGLIAVIMMVIAALLTSLTFAREWERGTMEQLISTPVTGAELIFGKLAPYFTIGMFDVLLSVAAGIFIFKVPLYGAPILVIASAAIFLVGALSLGMIISIVAKGQLLASQLAMVLTFIPSYLLSGFMFSISNMPRTIRIVTYLIPARYFVALLKSVYLKGIGPRMLMLEGIFLIFFGIATVLFANLKFKKKLV
jgi:ABC-2 type transport system permease protein